MLVGMKVSASAEKHLMMDKEMEILTELQVWVGFGFCLQVLQLLWKKDKAASSY